MSNFPLNQELPHSLEAECMVLGTVILYPREITKVGRKIKPEHFYVDSHQRIYQAVMDKFDKNEPIDLVSVVDYLKTQKSLEAVGGADYLTKLIENAIASGTRLESCVKIVLDKYARRRLIDTGDKISQIGFDEEKEADQAVADASKSMLDAVQSIVSTRKSYLLKPGDFLKRRKEIMNERIRSQRVLTGYTELDKHLTYGFAVAKISVIAGMPGVGKSALKTNLICKLCNNGFGVLDIAIEPDEPSELDRLDALKTGIPTFDLVTVKRWEKDDPRKEMVEDSNAYIDEHWKLFLYTKKSLYLNEIQQLLWQLKLEGNRIDVVFIDLFDRLQDVQVIDGKPQALEKALNQLSAIAQNVETHFCLLVQLKTKGVSIKNKPRLSQLFGSSYYEQTADLIWLLYREQKVVPDSLNPNIEIIFGKQRDGADGMSEELYFDKKTLRIGGE